MGGKREGERREEGKKERGKRREDGGRVGGRRGGKGKEGRRVGKDQVVAYVPGVTHCGQLLHIIIRGAQRCKTNFLKWKVLLEVSCYQSSKRTPFLFTCENWANTGSQNKGACPSSS